eukprot:PhF_6_TR35418/c0_g1_i2/m.51563
MTTISRGFFRKLHPYMAYRDYSLFKSREDFLKTQTRVCSQCFTSLTLGLAENQLTREFFQKTKFNSRPEPLSLKHRLPSIIRPASPRKAKNTLLMSFGSTKSLTAQSTISIGTTSPSTKTNNGTGYTSALLGRIVLASNSPPISEGPFRLEIDTGNNNNDSSSQMVLQCSEEGKRKSHVVTNRKVEGRMSLGPRHRLQCLRTMALKEVRSLSAIPLARPKTREDSFFLSPNKQTRKAGTRLV